MSYFICHMSYVICQALENNAPCVCAESRRSHVSAPSVCVCVCMCVYGCMSVCVCVCMYMTISPRPEYHMCAESYLFYS